MSTRKKPGWFTRPRFGLNDLLFIYVGWKIGEVMW